MANGSFHSMGRGHAWKRDEQAERQRQELERERAANYRARVVGRRVRVTADLDCGREGVVVDVVDRMLAVRLDGDREPNFFDRWEIEAAR